MAEATGQLGITAQKLAIWCPGRTVLDMQYAKWLNYRPAVVILPLTQFVFLS